MNYLAFITRSLVLFNDYYNYNIAKRLLKKYIYVLIYLLRRRVNKYINSNSFIFGKYFCRYPILLASYIKDE